MLLKERLKRVIECAFAQHYSSSSSQVIRQFVEKNVEIAQI